MNDCNGVKHNMEVRDFWMLSLYQYNHMEGDLDSLQWGKPFILVTGKSHKIYTSNVGWTYQQQRTRFRIYLALNVEVSRIYTMYHGLEPLCYFVNPKSGHCGSYIWYSVDSDDTPPNFINNEKEKYWRWTPWTLTNRRGAFKGEDLNINSHRSFNITERKTTSLEKWRTFCTAGHEPEESGTLG